MKKCIAVCIVALMLICLVSLTAASSEKLPVFVSIPPQAYFVERVGAPHVEVEVLVGAGKSAATYEPTPKQMSRLGRVPVYFRMGVPFERAFIDKLADTHEHLKIVDIRKGLKLRDFRRVELAKYKKAKGRKIPSDPHVWLDPRQAKIQAATVCEVLSDIMPQYRRDFEENLAAFQADLDHVDRKFAKTLAPFRGEKFYVFHPAFGYIADAYGLVQMAVEIEGKEPTPKQFADLVEMARADGVRVIFVQPQYAKKSAQAVAAAIGGAVVPLDPLARNYLENLDKMLNTLSTAMGNR